MGPAGTSSKDKSISYTPIRQYDEGETDATIRGTAVMFEAAADTLLPPSSVNPFPVSVITGGGGGVQYTEGDTDASISGTALLWEDTADTLRAASASKPLPVNVVAGATSGTQYTEGDTDATITGTAMLWEDGADTLRAVSSAKPLPADVVSQATTTDRAISGTLTGAGQDVTLAVHGCGSLDVALSGVWDAQLTFRASADGVTFEAYSFDGLFGELPANGFYRMNVSAFHSVQVFALGFTSGTVNVVMNASSASGMVSMTEPLPAGFNTIGSVGIDGSVAISSVIPGTGATNLGKAEDAQHTSGDVGVMALAVRSDKGLSLVDRDGDYGPPQLDEYGRLRIHDWGVRSELKNITALLWEIRDLLQEGGT